MKRNPSISIIRVLAMMLIIIGHYFVMVGVYDYQLTGVGVEIFLFISGYLYNNKAIGNTKVWVLSRAKRILPAYWISLVFVVVFRLLFDLEVGLNSLILYLFNLQGLDRIFLNVKIHSIKGISQTWFLTVLMVCYLLIVFFKEKPRCDSFIRKHRYMFLTFAFILQILSVYFGIQAVYIICFLIGYFWDKNAEYSVKKYACFSLLMFASFAIRILCRNYYDGTILYDHIIARWTFVLLAVWIIVTINQLCRQFTKITDSLVNTKFWRLLDMASYPLYLVHFVWVNGEFATINWCPNLLLATIMVVLFSVILATIIMLITQRKSMLGIFKGE